jgi:HD-like signal output (HDOD) protein
MLARFCAVAEDTAYSAGLLHDIGRLGLMVTYPSEYAMLLQTAASKLEAGEPFDLPEYERALFGLDRFAAGEQLARDWGLPEELRATAGRFPERTDTDELDLAGVIRAACRLANSLGFCVLKNPHGPSYRDILADLPMNVAASFPYEAEDLRARLEEEIAALDQDPRESESAPDMQVLLDIDHAQGEETYGGTAGQDDSGRKKSNLWPIAITILLALVMVLIWLQLRG